MPFSSPNYSNNKEVWICPAARTLFSVWPISGVLEVQMTSNVYTELFRQFPATFMFTSGSSSDGRIFVLFRQEDKDFHQVKSWPPTQQLVIKSIILNFGLQKEAFAMHLGAWLFRSSSCSLFLSLYFFFVIFKFCFH